MDDNEYNITCSCTEAISTDLPNCYSNIQNQTLATIYCFTGRKCAITSGVNKCCSCAHKLPNTTLVHSTLAVHMMKRQMNLSWAATITTLAKHLISTTTTISNAQSQSDHATGTLTTVHTVTITTVHAVAMTTNNAANTVHMTTTSSSSSSRSTSTSMSTVYHQCSCCYLVYHTALQKTSNTSTVRNNTVCTVLLLY